MVVPHGYMMLIWHMLIIYLVSISGAVSLLLLLDLIYLIQVDFFNKNAFWAGPIRERASVHRFWKHSSSIHHVLLPISKAKHVYSRRYRSLIPRSKEVVVKASHKLSNNTWFRYLHLAQCSVFATRSLSDWAHADSYCEQIWWSLKLTLLQPTSFYFMHKPRVFRCTNMIPSTPSCITPIHSC